MDRNSYTISYSPFQYRCRVLYGLLLSLGLTNLSKSYECSRLLSRRVRSVYRDQLQRYISFESINKEGSEFNLPETCAWHPSNDRYFDQERNKSELSMREWKCGYCGKIFRTEHYMDLHMHRHHTDKLNVSREL